MNPISASSGNMPPITCFIKLRPYSGTVLIGLGLYFVRGVERRLSRLAIKYLCVFGNSIQAILSWVILKVGELELVSGSSI